MKGCWKRRGHSFRKSELYRYRLDICSWRDIPSLDDCTFSTRYRLAVLYCIFHPVSFVFGLHSCTREVLPLPLSTCFFFFFLDK